jgi:hypothetical protein
MRTLLIAASGLAATLVFVMVPVTATARTSSELLKAERHFAKAGKQNARLLSSSTTAVGRATAAGNPSASSSMNMEVVAHNTIGDRGFNADVWEHEGYAYVGQWGFTDWAQGAKQRFCPSGAESGVAVIEVTADGDATTTSVVSKLQNPAGTSAEDVVVYTAKYGPLAGHDIAAVGIQLCSGSRVDEENRARGLWLWDVTDPDSPVFVGSLYTGCCTPGVHELEVEDRDDLGRTFVYASVPTSEYEEEDSPSGYRDRLGRGDFRLIDVTNPAAPVEVSDWGVIHDAGGPLGAAQGCDPDAVYGHSAEPTDDGTRVFVSYWDSGFIELDVSDPANPAYVTDSDYEGNEDGDAHSAMWDDARSLLFSADEDFCKSSGPEIEKGWGYGRVWTTWGTVGQKPAQLSTYRTPNSTGVGGLGAGDYTIHNPFLVGTDVYASWYSDGVQVFDASDPDPDSTTDEESLPRVAFFVPPAAQNPVKPSQRFVLSQTPQVWGVVVRETTDPNGGICMTGERLSDRRCLIFASDMNSGLWVLRRTD